LKISFIQDIDGSVAGFFAVGLAVAGFFTWAAFSLLKISFIQDIDGSAAGFFANFDSVASGFFFKLVHIASLPPTELYPFEHWRHVSVLLPPSLFPKPNPRAQWPGFIANLILLM
jgi:hypothetical protein